MLIENFIKSIKMILFMDYLVILLQVCELQINECLRRSHTYFGKSNIMAASRFGILVRTFKT